jgi:predicted enzyme related to lactoylglutathione lyase
MTMHLEHPVDVPCWVETFQTDPRAALEFYGLLFGWQFFETQPLVGGLEGEYFVAQLHGRDVAGIGRLPGGGPSLGMEHLDAPEQR